VSSAAYSPRDPRIAAGPNPQFTLRISEEPGVPRIRLACRGEIDAATAPQLRDAIAGLKLGDLIVDLCDTWFIDSTGLSTLLNALRRLTRQGHRLIVVCPPGSVHDTLRLTALLETLNVVDNQVAAERSLAR
jgi:anti-anti-sigma factor